MTEITLQGIADLAGVQRPVVSTWRRRPSVAGRHLPFPGAIAHQSGRKLFDQAEVVQWLKATGRGNNPEFAADAPLAAQRPRTALDDATATQGLDALLCLRSVTARPIDQSDPDELVDRADGADPDDTHLFREVTALGEHVSILAAHVERVWRAERSPASALARLRSASPATATPTRLTPAALDMLGALGAALAARADGRLTIVDAPGASSDVVEAIARRGGEVVEIATVVTADTRRARAARRAALVHGWHPAQPVGEGMRLHLIRLTGSGTEAALLGRLEKRLEGLGPRELALVLGSAPLLCDRMEGAAEQIRDEVLRLGQIRGAVRLPRGLLVHRPSEHLGLWLLDGTPATLAPTDRLLAVADLSNHRLNAVASAELVNDLVSTLDERHRYAHAYRFAAVHGVSSTLATREVVPPSATRAPLSQPTAAERALTIGQLVSTAVEGVVYLPAPLVTPRLQPEPASPVVSVAQALRARQARIIPGLRLDAARVRTGGAVAVLDSEAVRARRIRVRVDRLAVTAAHPHWVPTEPGDIVFTTAPRPAAMVDREGGGVAVFPAKVLRCSAAGLVPEAIAATINALTADAKTWRSWRVPLVPPGDAAVLGSALRDVEDARRRALDAAAALERLGVELTQAVAEGCLELTADLNNAERHDKCDDMHIYDSPTGTTKEVE